MQYGVFSDIHGGYAALKAVWDALAAQGLSGRPILNAGDNVGYGYAPQACVEFLWAHPEILTVQGNYDKNVASFPEKKAEYLKKWGKARPEKFAALKCDSDTISASARDWLRELPKERTLDLEGTRVLLTHYAPGSKEGLGRWTPDSRLRELAEATDARVVVCGHTHSPFVRSASGVLYVNPGTLGRSFFDIGRASYAVLTVSPGQAPSAELKRASYDPTRRD